MIKKLSVILLLSATLIYGEIQKPYFTKTHINYENTLSINEPFKKAKKLCSIINKQKKEFFFPYVSLAGIIMFELSKKEKILILRDCTENNTKKRLLLFLLSRYKKNSSIKTLIKNSSSKKLSPFFVYEFLIRGGNTDILNVLSPYEKDFFLAIARDKKISLKKAKKVYLKYRESNDPEEKLFYTIFYIHIVNNQFRNEKIIKSAYNFYIKRRDKNLSFDLSPLNFYYFTYYSIKGNLKKIIDILEGVKRLSKKFHQYYWYHFANIKLIETYSELYNLEKAKELYKESENFLKNSSMERLYAYLLSAISFYYEDFGLYSKAEEKLKTLLSLNKKSALLVYAFSLSQLSKIEYLLGKDKEAKIYAEKGLLECKKIGLILGINNSLQTLALLKIREKKYREGITLFNKIFSISKNEGRVQPEILRYYLYALIKSNQFKKALNLEKKIMNLKIPSNYNYTIQYYLYIAKKNILKNKKFSFFISPYYVFSFYKNISKAYTIVNKINLSSFKTQNEKLDYLKNKIEIFSEYASATKRIAIEILKIIILFITVIFLITAITGFIIKRKKKLIGPYYIKELIASGGMGDVFKAKSIETGEIVALKVLKDSLFLKKETKLRFKREAEVLKTLSHPGIVRILDSGEHKGKLYIALEYIKGKTLKQIISERWPLSIEESFKISAETLSALSYIHSKEIIHRDIKPSNIMIIGDKRRSEGFSIKLMDFGISKAIDMETITREGSIMGTPYYIPPEAIKNNIIDKRGDIFSFGVLMYELFTGEIPFYHTDPVGTIHKILNFNPQPPSKVYPYVPKCMDDIIMKCLRKNPEERYKSCDEILKDIIKCRIKTEEN